MMASGLRIAPDMTSETVITNDCLRTVIDPKTIDELSRRVLAALPPGLEQVTRDAREHARAAVTAALSNADLVSREEFDVQAAVLARTREKLEALEETVSTLESTLERMAQSDPKSD